MLIRELFLESSHGIVDRQLAKGIRELVESGSEGAPQEAG